MLGGLPASFSDGGFPSPIGRKIAVLPVKDDRISDALKMSPDLVEAARQQAGVNQADGGLNGFQKCGRDDRRCGGLALSIFGHEGLIDGAGGHAAEGDRQVVFFDAGPRPAERLADFFGLGENQDAACTPIDAMTQSKRRIPAACGLNQ